MEGGNEEGTSTFGSIPFHLHFQVGRKKKHTDLCLSFIPFYFHLGCGSTLLFHLLVDDDKDNVTNNTRAGWCELSAVKWKIIFLKNKTTIILSSLKFFKPRKSVFIFPKNFSNSQMMMRSLFMRLVQKWRTVGFTRRRNQTASLSDQGTRKRFAANFLFYFSEWKKENK